jgi:hypothetical protein
MAKSASDAQKGETLEDISSMVERLTAAIASKQDALAPLVQQLRDLRAERNGLQV